MILDKQSAYTTCNLAIAIIGDGILFLLIKTMLIEYARYNKVIIVISIFWIKQYKKIIFEH